MFLTIIGLSILAACFLIMFFRAMYLYQEAEAKVETAERDLKSRIQIIKDSLCEVDGSYSNMSLMDLPHLINDLKRNTTARHDSDWNQIGSLKAQIQKLERGPLEAAHNAVVKDEKKENKKHAKLMPPGHVFSFDGSEMMVVGFFLRYTPEGATSDEAWEWGPGWLCKWLSANGEKTLFITTEMAKHNNYWRNG